MIPASIRERIRLMRACIDASKLCNCDRCVNAVASAERTISVLESYWITRAMAIV